MDVKLVYNDESESTWFTCREAYTVKDLAYLDNIMHTNVQQMRVTDE
jgi:hypothetical protein